MDEKESWTARVRRNYQNMPPAQQQQTKQAALAIFVGGPAVLLVIAAEDGWRDALGLLFFFALFFGFVFLMGWLHTKIQKIGVKLANVLVVGLIFAAIFALLGWFVSNWGK
ncbi:MAG: hypothetical protein H3C49_10425 [Alphaproteobacteria bacterium]|nr:hypothetical protein [Alphaproteobacteria bacterium]